jgi:hypothetical protein
MLFPIVVVTVAMISVPMIAVTVVTVAGFEWPTPTHRPIFSIRDLKSKLGM